MPRLSARLYSGKSMWVEMMCVRSERAGIEPFSPRDAKLAPSSSRLSRNYNLVNKQSCTSIWHALPYQSGLFAVQLVAWDDCVVHTAKDQPAIFLLHPGSAVKLDLRDSCEGSTFCGVHGCGRTLYFPRVSRLFQVALQRGVTWRVVTDALSGAKSN